MKASILPIIIIGFAALSASFASAQALDLQMPAEAKPGEVTQEVAKQLTGTTNTVFVYAEGLCCPSLSKRQKTRAAFK